MIKVRIPWYTLFGGVGLAFVGGLIRDQHPVSMMIFFFGLLLLLDGGLGVHILGRLVPFASFPDDWAAIEQKMYLRDLGALRFAAALGACVTLALSGIMDGADAAALWSLVGLIGGWALLWLLVALRAIRMVLANND